MADESAAKNSPGEQGEEQPDQPSQEENIDISKILPAGDAVNNDIEDVEISGKEAEIQKSGRGKLLKFDITLPRKSLSKLKPGVKRDLSHIAPDTEEDESEPSEEEKNPEADNGADSNNTNKKLSDGNQLQETPPGQPSQDDNLDEEANNNQQETTPPTKASSNEENKKNTNQKIPGILKQQDQPLNDAEIPPKLESGGVESIRPDKDKKNGGPVLLDLKKQKMAASSINAAKSAENLNRNSAGSNTRSLIKRSRPISSKIKKGGIWHINRNPAYQRLISGEVASKRSQRKKLENITSNLTDNIEKELTNDVDSMKMSWEMKALKTLAPPIYNMITGLSDQGKNVSIEAKIKLLEIKIITLDIINERLDELLPFAALLDALITWLRILIIFPIGTIIAILLAIVIIPGVFLYCYFFGQYLSKALKRIIKQVEKMKKNAEAKLEKAKKIKALMDQKKELDKFYKQSAAIESQQIQEQALMQATQIQNATQQAQEEQQEQENQESQEGLATQIQNAAQQAQEEQQEQENQESQEGQEDLDAESPEPLPLAA